MFEQTPTAPPDAIFGLADAFKKDPSTEKINLGIGIYRDSSGKTPVLRAVHQAEKRVWAREATKSYLPIEGDQVYAKDVQRLLLGDEHPVLEEGRLATAQTPGGTGAIRVAADFLKRQNPGSTAWVSDPTWVNHKSIFAAVDLPIATYPYLDSSRRRLDIEAMIAGLEQVSAGDVVVLHGCCHNPSGVDPRPEEWRRIGEVLSERGALPLVDLAYQGFGRGLVEDRESLMILTDTVPELIICNSFSKNFALYNERIGALTVITTSAEAANAVLSQLRICIRVSYSNPPAHGASIVATILGDADLSREWQQELSEMRSRIHQMRASFADGLNQRGLSLGEGSNEDFLDHNGMFSFTGLQPNQIDVLRNEHSIYMLQVEPDQLCRSDRRDSAFGLRCDCFRAAELARSTDAPVLHASRLRHPRGCRLSE